MSLTAQPWQNMTLSSPTFSIFVSTVLQELCSYIFMNRGSKVLGEWRQSFLLFCSFFFSDRYSLLRLRLWGRRRESPCAVRHKLQHLAGAFVLKGWPAREVNASINPENQQRDKKQKRKKKPPPQLGIKMMTELSLCCKKKKNAQKNIPRNIWVLCRNHNLYNPSTIIYN